MFIGKFDPKTLKLTEYPIKKFKPDAPESACSASTSTTPARSGSTPCTRARSAPRSEDRGDHTIRCRREWNDNRVQLNFVGLRYDVDGKVWTKSVGTQDIFRLELKTGKWDSFHPDRRAAARPPSASTR